MADMQESKACCPTCVNLHRPAWTLQDFVPTKYETDLDHSFSPKDVVISADKGCRGCRLITRIFPYDLSDASIRRGYLTIGRPNMNVKISMWHFDQESYEDPSSEYSDWTDVRELLTTFGSGHPKVGKISSTCR